MPRMDSTALVAKMRSLADNLDFQGVYKALHEAYVRDIESIALDGSPEKERKVLEHVRKLHALADIMRQISKPVPKD